MGRNMSEREAMDEDESERLQAIFESVTNESVITEGQEQDGHKKVLEADENVPGAAEN